MTGCGHVAFTPTLSHQASVRSHRRRKTLISKTNQRPPPLFDERHLCTEKLCNFQSRWKRWMLWFSAAAGLISIYRSKKRSWRPQIKALPKLQTTLTLLIKLICNDAAHGNYANEDYLKTINCGTTVSTFSNHFPNQNASLEVHNKALLQIYQRWKRSLDDS